jgi:predicted house-cleaning noncanonical NTP pyrophosphatase (MazG superfamily)
MAKLVRDLIPALIEYNENRAPTTVKLEGRVLIAALKDKLLEEADEVIDAVDQKALTEELADILEVSQALAKVSGIDWDAVTDAQALKRIARGGFESGTYLL